MKKLSIVLTSVALGVLSFSAKAQTADEIISNYHEVTGGEEAWGELEGMKMVASVNQGGMEIPLQIIQLEDGKRMVKINLQGQEIVQMAYDGDDIAWTTNFQTMKPEKMDQEMIDLTKQEAKDFPDALYNYKEKGYKAELIGEETMDGVETYKVKLTKDPLNIDGKEVENVEYYYFDKDSGILIAQESEVKMGPQKGIVSQTTFSDYQEVEGLYFPFSLSQGVKGGGSQPIQLTTIEINPEVDESEFEFPEEEVATEDADDTQDSE